MAMSVASAQAEPDSPPAGAAGPRPQRKARAATPGRGLQRLRPDRLGPERLGLQRLRLPGLAALPKLSAPRRRQLLVLAAMLSLLVLAVLTLGAAEQRWCCSPTLIGRVPPPPAMTATGDELVPDAPPALLEPGKGAASRRPSASAPGAGGQGTGGQGAGGQGAGGQGAGSDGTSNSPASPLRYDSAALQQQREARRRALAVSNGLIEAQVPGLDSSAALFAPADPDAAGGVTQGRRADQGVKAAPLSVPKGAIGDPGSPLMQALRREGAASVNARIARGEFGDGAVPGTRAPAPATAAPPQQLAAADAWTATTRVVPTLPQRVPSTPKAAQTPAPAAGPAAAGRRILNAVLDEQGRLVDLFVSNDRGARVSITADCARYIADARSRGRAFDLSGGVCGASEVRYPRKG